MQVSGWIFCAALYGGGYIQEEILCLYYKTIVTAFCISSAFSAAPLTAQTTETNTGTSVEINPLTIKGLVVGKRVSFGADFAAKHNIVVPIAFSFTIPTDRTKTIRVEPAPGGSAIYKVNFATDDVQLKSSLQFVPITIPMGEDAARKQFLTNIANQAFVASVIDPDKAQIDAVRPAEIGPYLAAVEALGRYDGGADGLVALRVVAIVGPDSEQGLVGIVNALPKNAGMEKVGDIMGVDGSRALGTLRFD